jgi:hypothetical protein
MKTLVAFLTATAALIALVLVFGWSRTAETKNVRTPRDSSTLQTCEIKLQERRKVLVDGKLWLTLGRPCVRKDGEEFCDRPTSPVYSSQHGLDPLGSFIEDSSVLYVSKGLDYDDENPDDDNSDDVSSWEVSHRFYKDDPTTLLFGQHFLDGFEGTSVPAPEVRVAAATGMASWFPAFQINDDDGSLGYLEFNGMFMGSDGYHIGPVADMGANDALMSGPLALFDDKCVVVLSTASAFMSSSSYLRTELDEFGFGVMGSMTSIPKGHRTSTILSSSPRRGPDGIRQAFSAWGVKLMKMYKTQRPSDVTLDYLQYSTDNGAFYYYNTEPNKTYQETIIEVKEYAEKIGLPFRSWLMDSWWYFKGPDGGVKNWTAMPNIFPDGIARVTQATKWGIVAHNRWWTNATDYAKQNGGDYDFFMEGDKALPLEERFWDDLFQEAKLWGLTVYEQDWLNVQTQSMNLTLQNVEAARTWLVQMGNAAKRNGLPIQYCMSWPRHILQSLEIDAVTQGRASDDYQPGNDNWQDIGISSMFSYALGVAPYKDNFWSSTEVQPNERYDGKTEPASRLHAIVATYSTASVAPSDQMKFLDVDLIMKSCAEDGKLLRPDKPAVRTDATILAQAGIPLESQQRDQVWSTMSELSGYIYTYSIAANSPEFDLTVDDLYPSAKDTKGFVMWDLDAPFKPHSLPYSVPKSNRTNAHVYCIAPIFSNGWSFLGEAETKWTAVSQDRFSQLVVLTDGFSVSMAGAPGELVQMMVHTPSHLFIRVSCTLPSSGMATFHSALMGCSETDSTTAVN